MVRKKFSLGRSRFRRWGTALAGLLLTALPAYSRSATAQDVEAEGWVAVTTADFTLFTDDTPERGAEIAGRLQQFRDVFARLAPSLELVSPAPTTLFAFKDARSYAPFKARADGARTRTLGQFTRTRDGNYLTLDASAPAFGVIYHEYVHFLVLNNFPRVPLWFNEGLAEYYSTFETRGREIRERRGILGLPVERHVKRLEQEVDFSLDELILVSSAEAAEHDGDEVGRFYSLSWLLVHYLISGGEEEIDRIVDYFLLLDEGEDPERAFEEAFERRLSTLADELRTYVQTGSYPSVEVPISTAAGRTRARSMAPADVLYHLGDLSTHLKRPTQGRRLFNRSLRHHPEHADSLAGLAYLLDLERRFDEAEVLYADALKRGPSQVVSYLRHGRHALTLAQAGGKASEAQAKRARASLAEAVSRYPSFGEAHGLLALAHALPDGDLDRALRSIRKARKLLPSRLDLVARQIQILLRLRRVDDAEQLLIGSFEPRSDDFEQIDSLWEDIDRVRLILRSEEAFENDDPEAGLRYFDEAVSVTTDEDLRLQLEAQLQALRKKVAARR